jgi:hypothetical protein
VSVVAEDVARLEDLCREAAVPCHRLGRVGGSELTMSVEGPGGRAAGLSVPFAWLEEVYESALPRAMGE